MNHQLGKKLMIMPNKPVGLLFLATLALPVIAWAQPEAVPDPNGILRKPIPDKLVVLTFDDACASGYTVAAPILKPLGFGGSFYVCDFDSFKTRKDWYLTWRQMKALNDEGFEVGNHTVGHGGSLEGFVAMDNELFANHGPKMTTVCWPLYMVNWNICQDLAKNGYTFGRGGHECPYRPTLDNPFDVPSYTMNEGVTMEAFIKIVRRAVNGKIVVLTYHGVPDGEHQNVSVKPETFQVMMQYLKDNHYEAIAMRDLTRYIDPAKAAKLPQKSGEFKEPEPITLATEDKPYLAPPAKDIQEFNFPNLPSAAISKTNINVTVPYATDVTSLMPNIKVSDGATVTPASGTKCDFSKPQIYTVTSRDGSKKTYTVTVVRTVISAAKDMLGFALEGDLSTAISKNRIGICVPSHTNVTALAPTFTLPPFATAVPASGTARDFTKPQTYTITAQDGSSQTIIVAVVKSDKPNAFTWSKAGNANWSDATKWSANPSGGAVPAVSGQADYILNFAQTGACTLKNDLQAGFVLNQLVLGDHCGGMVLEGNGLTFSKSAANSIPPVIRAGKCSRVDMNVPVILQDDLQVNTSPDRDPNCFISFNEVISGQHALMLNSSGDSNVAGINFHDVHFGILQLNNSNTYTGGTLISGGKIIVRKPDGLGSGPVTLDNFGTLSTESTLANPLVINHGTLFHCSLSSPVKLNGIATFISDCDIAGGMSGTGGFTLLGTNGTYLSMVPGGTVTLHGANTYTGPTTVFPGTLIIKKAAGLYHADPAKWTPTNITIHKAATLRLNVGGPDEFTGEHVGKLVGNLTGSISDNGLMGGAVLCLDTSNAKNPVVVSAIITDAKGPGGGPFLIKKCGPGTIRLAGNNTYTGQTVLESGTLSVSSFNSFTKGHGKTSSSLGAPTDIESGEIVIGEEGKDSDCALIYTGTGESTDRVMNLAGKRATVTFNQSGSGLLKLTSDLLISGYGADKTIALTGDTAGSGEIAGAIANPYDRADKAITSVVKSGAGIWVLSGTHTYTGPTTVKQGTLSIASAKSLGDKTDVYISEGAMLELGFKGEMHVSKLYLDGKLQPVGTYNAGTSPKFIKGAGILSVRQ